MAKAKGVPIVVLGMHRSGTSVVANILNRVGISMGEEFLDPDGFNPKGYFEDKNFLWINKGIFENASGIWYEPPSVKEIKKGGEKFEKAIKKAVSKRRQKAGLNSWGWKDPRNCLTCWNYYPEILDARFIVVVRRFADIRRSLNTTHGHLANWAEVIDVYYDSVELFLETQGNLSLLVSFEEIVYEKYAKNTVSTLLNFVNKPERLTDKALSVIQFR